MLLILSLLAFKLAASAQPAQVTGIITDANSALIPGAQLTLTNVDTTVTRKAVTNADGYYSIPFVPSGNYQLNVLASCFKPVTRNSLSIYVDQSARIDFTQEIGAINESVNITGNGSRLERETSAIGQVFENKIIVTLPLNVLRSLVVRRGQRCSCSLNRRKLSVLYDYWFDWKAYHPQHQFMSLVAASSLSIGG